MTERENEMTAMNTSGKRQVKASEVKPGMTVRWKSEGFTHEGTVGLVTSGVSEYRTRFINSPFVMDVLRDTLVTVLSEPQPEEPTEFGARVTVNDLQLIRRGVDSICAWEDSTGLSFTWRELLRLGPVQVVPNQGWTVPTDTPEVPERLCAWPENDEHLRGHKWRDNDGDTVQYVDGAWRYLWSFGPGYGHTAPLECAPWVRADTISEEVWVTDWPSNDTHMRTHPWVDRDGDIWTWNKADSEWDCEDPCGRFQIRLSTPSHGPWTRKDD